MSYHNIFKRLHTLNNMLEEKQKSWIRRHWIISGITGFFALFLIIGLFQGINKGITGDVAGSGITKENLPASYDEAKQKAVSVSYEDLMRYSESYKDKWVCFEGQVVQVISDIPNLEIRVSTKKEDMGEYWDLEPLYLEDIIYLYTQDYSGERLLEEDIIQFCGKSTGIVTYEAVLGNQMSIPGINTKDLYVKRIN